MVTLNADYACASETRIYMENLDLKIDHLGTKYYDRNYDKQNKNIRIHGNLDAIYYKNKGTKMCY